nr:unnamed protein product [Timema bartmani]
MNSRQTLPMTISTDGLNSDIRGMIMDDLNDPINLELSRVLPLYPAIGARKKPVLIENPAAALTLRTSHDPRDIVASCMSALVGVQPVGAFDESVTWTGGDASPYGHRKAAFLALGGFCCLAKPLTVMNCR